MMVIDTVHSSRSTVSRNIHADHTWRMMKIDWSLVHRRRSSLKGSEAKSRSTSAVVEKKFKDRRTVSSESRPSLVTRRRIMVPQVDDEADDSRFHRRPVPALMSNQPLKSSTTSTPSSDKKQKPVMDHRLHFNAIFARSASAVAATQDHHQDFCKRSAASIMPIKAPKTVHLFDLNELPPALPIHSTLSPVELSSTLTIASADSTTVVTASDVTAVMVVPDLSFLSKYPSLTCVTKTFIDGRGGAKLAVDLGLLPPAADRSPNRTSMALPEMSGSDVPTPRRKRLRKLSEYHHGGGIVHHRRPPADDDIVMAKYSSDQYGGDDVCNHRDNIVCKTLAILPPPEPTKARGKHAVEAEVVAAASVLMMMSTSPPSLWTCRKRNREDSSIAEEEADLGRRDIYSGHSTSSSSLVGSGGGGGGGDDDDDDQAGSQTSSGSSVLLRPSNKQRYRSMAELMEQTPILRRV